VSSIPLITSDDQQEQLYLFAICDHLFAVSPKWLDSIIAPVDIIPTPGVPAHIQGLCAVQNKVVAVFDCRYYLLESGQIHKEYKASRYMILTASGMEAAIPISVSYGFKSLKEFEIDEQNNSIVYTDNDVFRGLIRYDGKIVRVINAASLLSVARVPLEEVV